jgi:LCP family protein required for cell wall assembly
MAFDSRKSRRQQQTDSPIRHGRLSPRSAVRRALKLFGVVVAVLAVTVASVAGIAVWSTLSHIKPGVHLTQLTGQKAVPPPQVGAIPGAVNILLAGTDSRTGQLGFQDKADLAGSSGAGNNDVTMVLHISADHTHAVVISIPRDELVKVPACPQPNGSMRPGASMAMFNTTVSRGGLPCVVLAGEQLTGLNIQYAALISFDGVIGMSNAVGGVTVCLATPIKDPYVGLNLGAGEVTLEGANALAFVRSRHGIGDGSDLGRISSQQMFLSALMRKITSEGVLNNPLTLFKLANAAVNNMQFSDTLASPTTMVAIALALKHISLNNIVFLQYPTKSNPAYPGRVVAEEPDDAILNADLAADKPLMLSGKLGRATVLAPTTPGSPTATATPSASSSSPPIAGAALPADVTGQTAAQQTCVRGY